jgi:rRNA-processing protein FCF1
MAKPAVRRTVIREWMSLAREKRRSEDQAVAFAKQAAQKHNLPRSRRDPHSTIMAWLLPRTGKP